MSTGRYSLPGSANFPQTGCRILLRNPASPEPNINTLNGSNQIGVKGGIHDEGFIALSSVVLGPSLSRSCPAVLYKLGTSSTLCNVCTRFFVKLFRNC
jgi:hypothetical protein